MKKLSIKEMVKNRKKKGFTLIELIIVIAIIAILAAMAIPKFSAVRQSANIKTDIASAKNIQTAAATLLAQGASDSDAQNSTKIGQLLDGGYPKPKAVSNGEFKVTIDPSTKDIKVNVGDDEVYPAQQGKYATSESGSSSASSAS